MSPILLFSSYLLFRFLRPPALFLALTPPSATLDLFSAVSKSLQSADSKEVTTLAGLLDIVLTGVTGLVGAPSAASASEAPAATLNRSAVTATTSMASLSLAAVPSSLTPK
ncbi:hypothetical protein BDQ17DRAFT_1438261 [Cyathus striatus]|nr:hypothetical protein BDQ17DRAFT_1438261 [Cyathus striatus]